MNTGFVDRSPRRGSRSKSTSRRELVDFCARWLLDEFAEVDMNALDLPPFALVDGQREIQLTEGENLIGRDPDVRICIR